MYLWNHKVQFHSICGTPNVLYDSINTLRMTFIPYTDTIFLLFYMCISKLRDF